MSPDGRSLLGEGREIVYVPHHPYLEGPKVHKIGEWYYILAPGGGVPTGWQVAFRSREIYGPYEEKIVLERGSTSINGPHQGALVDLPNGEWWFFHFQDAGPFGRIVHLQPVVWTDGWPHMGVDYDGNGIGEPVATWRKPAIPVTSSPCWPITTDEFDHTKMSLAWQWHANHEATWANLEDRPGWLRLFSRPRPDYNLGLTPHFLGQKYPAPSFAVETLLDFTGGEEGEIAGLAVVGGKENVALAVRKQRLGDELVFLHNGLVSLIGKVNGSPLRLRVRVASDGSFSFYMAMAMVEGAWAALPQSFRAAEGAWLGAKVGLFSLSAGQEKSGYADFDYFRFTQPNL